MLLCFCYKKHLLFLGLYILVSFYVAPSSTAENIPTRPAGKLVPSAKKILPIDTTRHFQPFLVVALTDTSKTNQQERKTKLFYQKLKETFYKTRITKEIFDLLFVSPSPSTPKRPYVESRNEQLEQYKGQIVRNIEIKKLDLFGPTVTDTTRQSQSWLQKALNNLHTTTRSRVIRRNLFFDTGERIDPDQLADNERVLRELSFIRDARIYVNSTSEDSDSVDVLVLVQDVLPYSVGGRFGSLDRSSVELRNNNLAGIGHEFSNELIFDNRQAPNIGYRGIYYIPNFGGSFINTQFEYTYTDWEKRQGVQLQRQFITPEIRWAGGLQLYNTDLRRGVLFQDKLRDSIFNYQLHYSDAWGAYAFRLGSGDKISSGERERSRIVMAARFSRNHFLERPPVSDNTNDFFHTSRLYLASVGWSQRNFYRDRYLFGFGRTEDIPYGTLLNFTFGHESREFGKFQYAGLNLTKGRYFWKFGYLLGQVEAGSFFKPNWQAERRQLHLHTSYYSPLTEAGNYSFRQIISIDYLYGDRRFEHEFLTIGRENIRGFHTWEQRGTQRFSLRIESISFTPLYILGFQFAAYAFADLSFLNNLPKFSLYGEDFHGYGLGFRIRNENLTFNTFQVRFAIYPSIPQKSFGLSISTISRNIFKDFLIGKPQPLLFQ